MVRLRLKRIPRDLIYCRNLRAQDWRFSVPNLQQDRQMTALLDAKRSEISNLQNLDEATLDQVLARSPRWRQWSGGARNSSDPSCTKGTK
jgi:hypothetical protein